MAKDEAEVIPIISIMGNVVEAIFPILFCKASDLTIRMLLRRIWGCIKCGLLCCHCPFFQFILMWFKEHLRSSILESYLNIILLAALFFFFFFPGVLLFCASCTFI